MKPTETDVEQPRPSASSALDVPLWLQRVSTWAWRLGLVVLTIAGLAWLLHRLRVVVVPLLVAVMIAAVVSPIVARFEGRGLPRLAATWLALVLVVTPIAGTLGLAAWGLGSELTGDTARWTQVGEDVRRWLEDGPLDLSSDTVDDLERRVRRTVIAGSSSFDVSRARLLAEVIGGAFLTLALSFFFLKDGRTMWAWMIRRVHPDRRDAVDRAGCAAAATLASYLKAVAITGAVDAIVIGVGLYFIGVPLVIPLAVITFFAAFLPIVGATTAGALAATVALVANGPGDAVLVILLTLVVQQVEGDVLMPMIMRRQVPLHPAVVLAALAAGGALAGIVGAFVAVPVAALTTAAVGELRSSIRMEQIVTVGDDASSVEPASSAERASLAERGGLTGRPGFVAGDSG